MATKAPAAVKPQFLILPINKAKLTASMSTLNTTDPYYRKFGFYHYGNDFVSTVGDRIIWGSGNGKVVGRGWDNVVGNVLVVQYDNCQNAKTGAIQDVVIRYFHLASFNVKVGDAVTKDTKLGVYGNTGSTKMALHLHLEIDTDTKNFLYSPTVLRSNYLKGRALGANAQTIQSAINWFYQKQSAPDNQTFTTANDIYIKAADKTIIKVA